MANEKLTDNAIVRESANIAFAEFFAEAIYQHSSSLDFIINYELQVLVVIQVS